MFTHLHSESVGDVFKTVAVNTYKFNFFLMDDLLQF